MEDIKAKNIKVIQITRPSVIGAVRDYQEREHIVSATNAAEQLILHAVSNMEITNVQKAVSPPTRLAGGGNPKV